MLCAVHKKEGVEARSLTKVKKEGVKLIVYHYPSVVIKTTGNLQKHPSSTLILFKLSNSWNGIM
jgi:hypothetical protein